MCVSGFCFVFKKSSGFFSIRILSSAFSYPHFIIRIFLSAILHPPSAAIRSSLYRDPYTNGVSFRVKARTGSGVPARLGKNLAMHVLNHAAETHYAFTSVGAGIPRIAGNLASSNFTPSSVILCP